jgi:hypothetical protein
MLCVIHCNCSSGKIVCLVQLTSYSIKLILYNGTKIEEFNVEGFENGQIDTGFNIAYFNPLPLYLYTKNGIWFGFSSIIEKADSVTFELNEAINDTVQIDANNVLLIANSIIYQYSNQDHSLWKAIQFPDDTSIAHCTYDSSAQKLALIIKKQQFTALTLFGYKYTKQMQSDWLTSKPTPSPSLWQPLLRKQIEVIL